MTVCGFKKVIATAVLVLVLAIPQSGQAQQTVALWLFDEQQGLYPSSVLNDASGHEYVLVLGRGGRIMPGRFGNALLPAPPEPLEIPKGTVLFGLSQAPTPEGRTVEPMSWHNAHFAALMTMGENHLRKEVAFVNPTTTGLNLGDFDWTVEFWYRPTREVASDGVVYEVGTGPRGENDRVTCLTLAASGDAFTLFNQPSGARVRIPTETERGMWHHYAFVYEAAADELRHYVDGRPVGTAELEMTALPEGEEAYLSVGRDGRWERPLVGALDELRVSRGQIYEEPFTVPGSFAKPHTPYALAEGLPLLFREEAVGEVPASASCGASGASDTASHEVVKLGSRKHLFIDDAIVAECEHVTFVVNPPRLAEKVIDDPAAPMRKHLTVVEDESGLLRIYAGVADDYLGVWTSRDGVRWEMPDLGRGHEGWHNIVIAQPTATGTVFIDPNAPPGEHWKYIGGYNDNAIYVYSSPDGWNFRKHTTSILPFRVASQANIFYDAQRQTYAGYWRTGFPSFPSGDTRREWVFAESKDLMAPWPFEPVSQEETWAAADTMLLRQPQPWYLDNGPLTPGGFGIEYPTVFGHLDGFDPISADVYVPKAIKYPWAPDTYFAFPLIYFHWDGDGPPTRLTLGAAERGMGSGPVETQLSVSRDGTNWQRYPRPAYVGIGRHAGDNIHQAYLANGMIRRGDEIWQYYYGTTEYHSNYRKEDEHHAVYRVVQRLDGFVSADTPYDTTGTLITKPLTFEGNRLVLNIDTDAAGYAQVGFLDESGRPVEGYSVDDCVYINGDFIEKEVEWLGEGKDISELAGRVVQVVFRIRGSKLYAMQFVQR